jgi:CheY-like chemotaxis protein
MEAVGQLVAGLAHDFNNVLGAMVGAFDMVQRRADEPDRVRRFAEAGLQAGERGAKLTAQLLAFSRSQRIQLQPVQAHAVVEAMRELLARTLGPMIRLELALDPARLAALADPTQLEMTLLNLAINARDAMPEGGTLRIATAARRVTGDGELPDGTYVELAVSDTGTGMDEPTLRRAMEPFFTTKPIGRGTGLGLAQIYGSAKQAGGTVRIESVLGRGTTVRVLLPATEQLPPDAVDAPSPADLAPGPAHVLLVDDDDDVRSVLASAMEAQGCRVAQASDGHAALALIEAEAPDVAVIDFAMPEMNGAELARRIAERWPGLPIIFASGFSDTAAIEAVSPGSRMLRKPFRVDELLRAVTEVVSRRE